MGSKSTFCVLPWLQLSCKTNGAIRTCGYARVTSGGQPNLGREEVSSAWNSDYFKTIRRSMLAGDKPPNCAKCYYRESHGGTSRRQKENLAWLAELTEERAKALTRPDGSIDTPPVLLDVRTGNVCNLKCVTCFPTNSTKWLEDKDLLGKYENTLNYDVLPAWDQADGPAWRFVREFGKSLKKISFLGGEPLASLLHHSILDSLIEQQAFQVSLKYVTNGTLLKPELLDKWAKFDSVQLMVSLDGIGPVLEFIRFPAQWTILERNLRLLQDKAPKNVRTQILWTCSNLSLFYLPETISFIHEHFPSIEFVTGDYVTKPVHLNPQNLPRECKDLITNKFSDTRMADLCPQSQFYINNMKAAELWSAHGSTLLQYLDDLDRVRNTNWRATFSELSHHLK